MPLVYLFKGPNLWNSPQIHNSSVDKKGNGDSWLVQDIGSWKLLESLIFKSYQSGFQCRKFEFFKATPPKLSFVPWWMLHELVAKQTMNWVVVWKKKKKKQSSKFECESVRRTQVLFMSPVVLWEKFSLDGSQRQRTVRKPRLHWVYSRGQFWNTSPGDRQTVGLNVKVNSFIRPIYETHLR